MAFQSPRNSKSFTPRLAAFVLVVFPVLYSAPASAQHHNSRSTGLEIRTSAALVGTGRPIEERTNRKTLQGLKGSISVPLFATKLAMAQPQTATPEQALTQTPETGSTVKKKSSKLKWILIAAAGAAVGGVVATRGGASSSSQSGMTTNAGPMVTVGPPTVGPPQ